MPDVGNNRPSPEAPLNVASRTPSIRRATSCTVLIFLLGFLSAYGREMEPWRGARCCWAVQIGYTGWEAGLPWWIATVAFASYSIGLATHRKYRRPGPALWAMFLVVALSTPLIAYVVAKNNEEFRELNGFSQERAAEIAEAEAATEADPLGPAEYPRNPWIFPTVLLSLGAFALSGEKGRRPIST